MRQKRVFLNREFIFREECTLFNLDVPVYEVCEKIEADLKHHERLWSLYEEFRKSAYISRSFFLAMELAK